MTAEADVVGLGAELARAGLSSGRSGNASVRDGDRVVVTPTGARLDDLDPDALSVVALDGEHVGGPRPTKEAALHLAMYRRDPAARVVAHVHSPHATAVACLPPWSEHTAVAPFTPYLLMRVGQVPLVAYRDPGDPDQARDVLAHDLPFRAVLLAHHGPVLAAADVESALAATVEVEEACRVQLALAGSAASPLDAAATARLTRAAGTPWTPRT